MAGNPILLAVFLISGICLVIFARPIATWDYKMDARWKITLGVGVNFRIWFFRIAGIILICLVLFVLVVSWAQQFT